MKALITLSRLTTGLVILLLISLESKPIIAQGIPQGINYQAAARNDQGEILANQTISAEVSLYLNSESEPPVYREIHETESNAYGIFNLTVGQGISLNEGTVSDFSEIDWTAGNYIMKIRADFGSNAYLNGMQELGSYTLLSVPYAFSAENALRADSLTGDISLTLAQLSDVNISTPADMQILAWDADTESWILTDPGGLPDVFVRRDGSSDLTGDWTITNNSLTLENGNLLVQNGTITSQTFQTNTGNSIHEFSNDPLLADSSDNKLSTQSALKAYIDNSTASGPWNYNSEAVFLRSEKKVGIGTNSPVEKLHISLLNNEGFLVEGDFGGGVNNYGAGTRMSFFASRGAFRAGGLDTQANYWDDVNTGDYSAAFGLDNNAGGDYSLVSGRNNLGYGMYTTVFGRDNQGIGNYSFAAGQNNTASGLYSFVSGKNNSASGKSASAMGNENFARGEYSLAAGYQTQTGKDNGTEGLGAFSFGENTRAEANGSMAGGKNNTTQGNYSVISGENNFISGSGDHGAVFGKNNNILAQYGTAAGNYLEVRTYAESIFGQYNANFSGSSGSWDNSDPLFILGNGTSTVDRSNAFIVMKSGETGIGIGNTKPTAMFQVGLNGDGTEALANAWNIHSDIRLKKDMQAIDSTSEKLSKLTAYYYFWKEGKDTSRQIGISAQELQSVFPELVSADKKGILSVNYPVLTAVLIQGFNEQQNEIEQLKIENQMLHKRMKALEAKQEELTEYIKAQANLKMTED